MRIDGMKVLAVAVATIASAVSAEMLDDFESGLGGWGANGDAVVTLGTNPLTGSQAMVVTPPAGGGFT